MGNLENNIPIRSIKKTIPKIYKRTFLDAALFSWIKAQKDLIPNISIDQSIEKFRSHWSLTEDDWSSSDMRVTYNRITKEFFKKDGES